MEIINSDDVSGLIQRTLNEVDPRLIGHGKRVAYFTAKMLNMQNRYIDREKQNFCILAMLHDIGAYKTEEIDQMVRFETQNIWEHSIYGYLFVKYFTPLSDLSEIILYHHLGYQQLKQKDIPYSDIIQMINLADRVDVFMENEGADQEHLHLYLEYAREERFDPEIVDLFWETEKAEHIIEKVDEEKEEMSSGIILSEEEVDMYLKMLIYVIDFRSRHTVTHTITTMTISSEIAKLMHVSEEQRQKIYYGAMMHDLGKIGVPVEILEYPGKLSYLAMRIMRTHVEVTERILGDSLDKEITQIALRHHEKIDGSGYPDGLKNEELTLSDRIVAIADIVSALCGTRSYKDSYPKERTLKIIQDMSDNGLIDPVVTTTIVQNFDRIMDTVYEKSKPVQDCYNTIQEQYVRLLKETKSE